MMNRLQRSASLPALALLALIVSPALCRADTVFTDRTTWTAASTGTTTVDFEGVVAPGDVASYGQNSTVTFGDATFTGINGTYSYLVDPAFSPVIYDWGSGAVLSLQYGLPSGVLVSFAGGITSFGVDLMTFTASPPYTYGANLNVTLSDGSSYVVSTSDYPNREFFGVTTTTLITWVQITSLSGDGTCGSTGQCFNLDNVSYGSSTAVPEPATLILFGTGMGMAALAKRRLRHAKGRDSH